MTSLKTRVINRNIKQFKYQSILTLVVIDSSIMTLSYFRNIMDASKSFHWDDNLKIFLRTKFKIRPVKTKEKVYWELK